MASHYLFLESKDAVSLIDPLRPRQRPNQKPKAFNFSLRQDNAFGDLSFIVLNDSQLVRITGQPREAVNSNSPIYTVQDMVSAKLVDFTSKKLEPGVRAYRADFFRPITKEQFAYATPYGKGSFGIQMKEHKGLDLTMLPFVDYAIGDPIEKAVQGTFSTYNLALVNNSAFIKYQRSGLILLVPARLIEKSEKRTETERRQEQRVILH